jgi:hypothetical protein
MNLPLASIPVRLVFHGQSSGKSAVIAFVNSCTNVPAGFLQYFVCVGRWGGGKDDKYFARLGKNLISVYETDTFSLLDKKSLKIENVVDFSWSPTDPIISLFVPETGGGNQPARVSIKFCIDLLHEFCSVFIGQAKLCLSI